MATDPALDKAAALADVSRLADYKGHPVVNTSIAITNAGDGLSNAMKIDPVEYELESTVYVVLECEVAKHTHEPLEDTGNMVLKQVLRAGVATVVDGSLVREVVDAQRAAIKRAKDEAAGQLSTDSFTPTDEADATDDEPAEDAESVALRRNHMAGNHTDKFVEGCEVCDQVLIDALNGENTDG